MIFKCKEENVRILKKLINFYCKIRTLVVNEGNPFVSYDIIEKEHPIWRIIWFQQQRHSVDLPLIIV